MAQNSYKDKDVLQQFNVTLIPKKEIINEYESITHLQESIVEGNPVLNIDCWRESQVLTFNQESGDGKALDMVTDFLHSTGIGKPLMSDVKRTDFSTPWSNQEDIKQEDSPQEVDPLGTSIKPETMCSLTLKACQTEETQIEEISMTRESPSSQTAETTDTHRDRSSSAKVSSSTQTESSPKLTKTTVAVNAQDQVIPITEIKRPSPSLDIKIYSCIECRRGMGAPSHFRLYRKCSLCSYATSCSTAFTKHRQFHTSQQLNKIRTRRGKKIENNRISIPRERKMKDFLMCVCGFISPYGDKAARHLLKCTEKSCYHTTVAEAVKCTEKSCYNTTVAEAVKDVAVCDKLESEEDEPGTLLSGEIGQTEGKEEVKVKELGFNETHETQTTVKSSVINTTQRSVIKDRSIDLKEAELLPYFLQKRRHYGKRRKSKWIDKTTELYAENIKCQLMDTSDIVSTLDLAPPTKKLMQLKRRGGVERLFTQPGRKNTITAAIELFERNLITLKEEEPIKLENNNERS